MHRKAPKFIEKQQSKHSQHNFHINERLFSKQQKLIEQCLAKLLFNKNKRLEINLFLIAIPQP